MRSLYVKQKGFPCFVSVEQDGTGNGLATALALSRGIGATKAGAIASSVYEETAMDLFAEQALWPNIIMLFRFVTKDRSGRHALMKHVGRLSLFSRKRVARTRRSATRCESRLNLSTARVLTEW